MRKTDVKNGNQYTAQICGKSTIVEILAEHPKGGWTARDLFTRKKWYIVSGRYLRYAIHPKLPTHF